MVVLALLVLSQAASALGLGEIRVRSQPGQPLVAEIPVISNEPGELEQLRAQLASPATFERVGLARPTGLVNGLDFAIVLSDDGKPIIRVTSIEPVQVDAVNFLVEVDWGQGRLVREYSALVNAPGVLASASQPIIEAPLQASSNAIVRAPEPAPATMPQALPPAAPAARAPAAPAPVKPVAATPTPVATPSLAGGQLKVQAGQSLSQIARDVGQGYNLDQTMLALLRANPDAFINNNINRLKQGAILRVPESAELAQLGESEAAALVRDQLAEWRQARRPIPQPVQAVEPAPAPVNRTPTAAATTAPRVAEARLEIAPPAATAATRAGTQSGIDAEGEGDMLANQQLTLTKEELAARESEVQELRTQVAELESLKQQQAKLIAMKDSELASAQQRLAQSQGDASQPLWLWAGLGLLVAGLVVAWLISRRRKPVIPAQRSGYDSAALAAALPVADAVVEEDTASVHDLAETAFEHEVPATLPEEDDLLPTPADPAQAWTTAVDKPTWHTGDGGHHVTPLNAAPAGRERLELAIAYLDLGDLDAARDLLNEVVAGGDEVARNEATQLLREIG